MSKSCTLVYKVAIPRPLTSLFDYLPPEGDAVKAHLIGARVRVPFGRKEVIGIIANVGESALLHGQVKCVAHIIDDEPLFPPSCWSFLCKAQAYYHHALGEVVFTGLPTALRVGKALPKKRALEDSVAANKSLQKELITVLPSPTLTLCQSQTLEAIHAHSGFQTFLLDGITGSGKTEIYIRMLQKSQAEGFGSLVLLPEIALTPQTIARFQERLAVPVLVYHSKVTPKAKLEVWAEVRNNPQAVVIGTRSALFLPFSKLGLIIVDEEHDGSFKQQDGFRYSARDLAVLRGSIDSCAVILGSATPSFESLYNAEQNKYMHLKMPHRVNDAPLPEIKLLDIRHNKLKAGLSAQMIQIIREPLERQEQVLVFLNRRGYASAYLCYECCHIAECTRCDAKMTYHQHRNMLQCHHCQKTMRPYATCPKCKHDMHPTGIGTEQLEETLASIFPSHPLIRIDSDTTRLKGSLEAKLKDISSGKAQILIGTQLLAKGHHFPNLTCVAIVDLDGGLFSPDFRAVEKMGQLITQVAGRSGREQKRGTVALQTFQPHNPLLLHLIKEGYGSFAQHLMLERKKAELPPFSHMAIIHAQAKNATVPEQFLAQLKKHLNHHLCVQMYGPLQSLMTKKQGYHRFQLVIQSSQRSNLHRLLASLSAAILNIPEHRKVRWSLDVDPVEIR